MSSAIIQDLVSSARLVREDAHSRVLCWMAEKPSHALSFESMLKLWRALLRSLWMTDTPERQEVLTDILSRSAIDTLGGPESASARLYGDSFWNSIAAEWEALDSFRLDKFYLLMRKLAPLTLNAALRLVEHGRVDGKMVPASIILFIIDNLLSFSDRCDPLLAPFVKLYLTTKNEIIALRIKENILNTLQNTSQALPRLCHEIAKSDISGYHDVINVLGVANAGRCFFKSQP
ncbi:hypothetical protein DI09_38p160 [Mitosporidium daphniae]|uniref:Uncharacterized protein n=1 Tax=Mitosporidium daphniae TaxID=1485682 RepID=A0A098VUK0_9MICR|nr:uncharacterized protein DI09_38p160 [Mitosporidium daphniae]KGG51346.1 hypothetical protein DI09_38p160 [Mitosporidium daphniae]|eukprot:XP_013237773.1 uncharacterized protein DI09_38p160 [Mitosporidium daphniae]